MLYSTQMSFLAGDGVCNPYLERARLSPYMMLFRRAVSFFDAMIGFVPIFTDRVSVFSESTMYDRKFGFQVSDRTSYIQTAEDIEREQTNCKPAKGLDDISDVRLVYNV